MLYFSQLCQQRPLKFPENEAGDRLDEIELLRRRCVTRAKAGRKPGYRAKVAVVNFLADFARQGRQMRLKNGSVEIEDRSAADKEQRRNELQALRREQLRTPSVQAFVRRMERIKWIDD